MLDDFTKGVIKKTVCSSYTEEKYIPIVKKLLEKLKESINLKSGSNCLKIILKEIGFRWVKVKNNEPVLIETHKIKVMRICYYKTLKNLEKVDHNI